MPPQGSAARRRRVRAWARRYGAWFRRHKVVGTLVTAFVLAVVTGLGTVLATALLDWFKEDYRITVEDNLDEMSTATGPRGGSYIVPIPIEDVGPPPNGKNDCVGRYEWAHDLGGVDADSTFLRLTVAAVGDHDVRIAGFEPRIVEEDSPAVGTHLTCPGKGEQPEVRSVGVDLDADPPSASVTDENGLLVQPPFDVRGDDQETFEVSALTFDCDCTWELDVHLLVDGERRTETVRRSDGEPLQTSGSRGARSYQFADGEWQAEEETGGGRPQNDEPVPPAPVDACSLLETATVAALLQQGVTQQATAPVTVAGLSEHLLTETRCLWVGSESSGPDSSTDDPALDSVEVTLNQFNDEDRAAEELSARLPMYPLSEATTVAGADEAYAGDGLVVARVGSLLVTVNVLHDSEEASRLAERFMTDVLALL